MQEAGPMAVTIRAAERRDLEALGRLGAMLMRTHYAFDPQRFLAPGDSAESGYAWFLGSILDDPDGRVLVAEEEDGTIVGYAYVALEPLSWKELRGPAGFIHDVAVAEGARRSGVAASLMQAAVEWLRGRGAPRVILWTAAQNDAAQTLFTTLGFRQTMVEMTMELTP
jgi:GNAT superfamily N-acetyltransferase